MKRILLSVSVLFCIVSSADARQYPYQDPTLPVEQRVEDLLSRMSLEEKVNQMSAQLLFMDQFYSERDYTKGHIRNVGHFLWMAIFQTIPSLLPVV